MGLPAAGVQNQATYTYSNNPSGSSKGDNQAKARVYAHGVTVNKFDAVTKLPVSGAVFAIRNASGAYLAEDGIFSAATADAARQFTTDETGAIADIAGLDEGTYTLVELKAPEGYGIGEKEIPFTLRSVFDADGNLAYLTASLDRDGSSATIATDASADKVTIGVPNERSIDLAITGGAGVAGIGLVVLIAGVLLYIMRARKRGQEMA